MIKFVEYNSKAIIDEMIKSFEAATGETLYPADERRIFLQQLLPQIIALKADINTTGNQNLLRYSQGAMLDELGDMFDVERIPPRRASCVVQYNLSAVLSFDVTIPKGSRVTTDGTYVFYTSEVATISAGQTAITVVSYANDTGAAYNGLVPHQIASMIDVIPYVVSVYNTTTTGNGGNIESDEEYRKRIRLSYQQYSTAGSEKAYKFWAKGASGEVEDVSVEQESPGKVNVYILPKSGYMASGELISIIQTVLSADKHRPLTDVVTVKSAAKADYNITLTYYISASDSADEQVIKAKVNEAVSEFVKQTGASLGISINPDLLRSLMLQCGAYKIDMSSPEYTELAKNQVGVVGEINVAYGGLKSSWN